MTKQEAQAQINQMMATFNVPIIFRGALVRAVTNAVKNPTIGPDQAKVLFGQFVDAIVVLNS